MEFRNDGGEETSLVLGEFTDGKNLGNTVDLHNAIHQPPSKPSCRERQVEREDGRENEGKTHSKFDREGEVRQVSDRSLGGSSTSDITLDVDVRRLDDTGLSLESSLNQSVDKLVSSCQIDEISR